MPSESSLDEKLSDFVGNADFKINEKFNLNYDFSLDHNYRDLNYNEIGAGLDLNPIKFNFSYLQEKTYRGPRIFQRKYRAFKGRKWNIHCSNKKKFNY